MVAKSVDALPYFGGKSNRTRLGKWVASLLPQRTDTFYVELCSGMAGILRQRERNKTEVLNDLNGRIVNFWRAVRDHTDELSRLMDNTPYSIDEFVWAVEHLDDETLSVPKRALAFVVAVDQGFRNSDGGLVFKNGQVRKTTWPLVSKPQGVTKCRNRHKMLPDLKERLRYVQLYNDDAIKLVRRTLKRRNSLLYFDPPYTERAADAYHVNEIDVNEYSELFQQHAGAIAISGCDGEWDHLGWEKHELPVFNMTTGPSQKGKTNKRRVEQVWCNYSQEDKETLW